MANMQDYVAVIIQWKTYVYLSMAIVFEVIATSALNESDGFNRWKPALLSLVCYAVAYSFLGLTLRTMRVGIAYGIWSGVGIVLISIIGVIRFRQMLDVRAIVGLALIVAGIVIIRFSESTSR